MNQTSLLPSRRSCLLLLLDHLLDNFSFFYEECTENPRFDAIAASRTAIRPSHRFLTLRDPSVLAGSQRWDAWQTDSAITAFGLGRELLDVVVDKLATGCFDNACAV